MSDLPFRNIARALVFDPEDRLLLIAYEAVRPIPGRDPADRRFWFMPGGGLEPGESHVEACRRELEEEIGVPDAPIGAEVCDEPHGLGDIDLGKLGVADRLDERQDDEVGPTS